MGLGSLNYLAVMTAAIASFVFGGVWYNVFSRQWMEAVGMSPERMRERGGVGLYVLAFAAACALSGIYGFFQGPWPFGFVETVWTAVALRRWAKVRSSP